jgi:hypothetical protein
MSHTTDPESRSSHLNEDPLTHEPGAHPVATGVGALGGGAAAAAIGLAVGGPVGGAIGAVVGAFAGGMGGSAVGESIDPTLEPSNSPVVPEGGSTYTPPDHDVQPEGEPLHWHEVIPSGLPSYEEISLRAYQLYEAEGRPEGQGERHWREAEEALKRES